MTNKIKNLSELSLIVKKLKKQGKTTGLITGCFDVLHMGHIDLFRDAKQKVNVVIVGLDNDKSIKLSKGNDRPINSLKLRMKFLSELISVDYIFPIKNIFTFSDNVYSHFLDQPTQIIMPDFLLTNPLKDKYWKEKKSRAKRLGIKYMALKRKPANSSTTIIRKLNSEL